jgi:hypothetical protein
MDVEVILELIDIAVSLAQAQFSGTELEQTLMDIVNHSLDAYNTHAGQTMELGLVTAEDML